MGDGHRWVLVSCLVATLGCRGAARAPQVAGTGGRQGATGDDGATSGGGSRGDTSDGAVDGPSTEDEGHADAARGDAIDDSAVEMSAAAADAVQDQEDRRDARLEGDAPPTCAGLFCEDFEQGALDPARWDVQTGAGGTLAVQTRTVAHGRYALQVHGVAGPADYALIVTKSAPAGLRGAHFGRANFLITPKPLTSGHTQMVFAGTNGTGAADGPGPFPKLRYLEVANIGGGWQVGFDLLDVSPLVEEVAYPPGSPRVPVTVWTCLEWRFDDAPDVVDLWVDGQAVGTFDDRHVSYPSGHAPGTPLYDGKSSGLIGAFTLFGFGFHDWHPNQPFDLYYDDIVLDTKRVGCPP